MFRCLLPVSLCLSLGACAHVPGAATPPVSAASASTPSTGTPAEASASADASTPNRPLGERVNELRAELGQSLDEAVARESERVDAFPDLPDASVGAAIEPASDGADAPPAGADATPMADAPGRVTERAAVERRSAFNPYVLTAHRQNYFMPVHVTTRMNDTVYRDEGGDLNDLQQIELRFQLSLKAQLNSRDLLFKDDSLSVGMTLEAWWQVYNAELSRPFRETNYTPEIFYLKPLLWGPLGGSSSLMLGASHQSNGRSVGLSRSWNRIYAAWIYERGDFVARLRPWYRIPEDEKDTPDDPQGDDNPDILDFMGHGDLSLYLRRDRREYALLARGNPATGKGALRVAYTFPLTSRFRGLVDVFVGYGDSLIDYDHFQQRVGFGIALTDLL